MMSTVTDNQGAIVNWLNSNTQNIPQGMSVIDTTYAALVLSKVNDSYGKAFCVSLYDNLNGHYFVLREGKWSFL